MKRVCEKAQYRVYLDDTCCDIDDVGCNNDMFDVNNSNDNNIVISNNDNNIVISNNTVICNNDNNNISNNDAVNNNININNAKDINISNFTYNIDDADLYDTRNDLYDINTNNSVIIPTNKTFYNIDKNISKLHISYTESPHNIINRNILRLEFLKDLNIHNINVSDYVLELSFQHLEKLHISRSSQDKRRTQDIKILSIKLKHLILVGCNVLSINKNVESVIMNECDVKSLNFPNAREITINNSNIEVNDTDIIENNCILNNSNYGFDMTDDINSNNYDNVINDDNIININITSNILNNYISNNTNTHSSTHNNKQFNRCENIHDDTSNTLDSKSYPSHGHQAKKSIIKIIHCINCKKLQFSYNVYKDTNININVPNVQHLTLNGSNENGYDCSNIISNNIKKLYLYSNSYNSV